MTRVARICGTNQLQLRLNINLRTKVEHPRGNVFPTGRDAEHTPRKPVKYEQRGDEHYHLLFAERYAWNEWNYTRSFDSCVMDEKLCDAEYYGVQQVDVEECKCQQQLHGTKQSCRAESFQNRTVEDKYFLELNA